MPAITNRIRNRYILSISHIIILNYISAFILELTLAYDERHINLIIKCLSIPFHFRLITFKLHHRRIFKLPQVGICFLLSIHLELVLVLIFCRCRLYKSVHSNAQHDDRHRNNECSKLSTSFYSFQSLFAETFHILIHSASSFPQIIIFVLLCAFLFLLMTVYHLSVTQRSHGSTFSFFTNRHILYSRIF